MNAPRFERVFTAGIGHNDGPSVVGPIDLRLPDAEIPLCIEAWGGPVQTGNVYIVDGSLDLAADQGILPASGIMDALLVVPASGSARRALPDNVKLVSVFFEAQNAGGSTQAVTLRVYSP